MSGSRRQAYTHTQCHRAANRNCHTSPHFIQSEILKKVARSDQISAAIKRTKCLVSLQSAEYK